MFIKNRMYDSARDIDRIKAHFLIKDVAYEAKLIVAFLIAFLLNCWHCLLLQQLLYQSLLLSE